MTCDLSPGDVVRFGNAVTLTILAIEGDLIRFKVESPERGHPGAAMESDKADFSPKQDWWKLN
jgi:hypothetical protein